jgi:SAM-dependent methyltransferase
MNATIDTTRLEALAKEIVRLPGVASRLRAGALVADVDCGEGDSTALLAAAFPRSAFSGYDPSELAIATARVRLHEHTAVAGGGRNVRFDVAGIDAIPPFAYDLVTTLDVAGPWTEDVAATARHVRRVLADDGVWLLAVRRAVPMQDLLRRHGFSHAAIAAATPYEIVLEARP